MSPNKDGIAYCRPRQTSAGGLEAQHVVQVLPRVLGHLVIVVVNDILFAVFSLPVCRLSVCHEGETWPNG